MLMENNNKCCIGIIKWTNNLRQRKVVKRIPIVIRGSKLERILLGKIISIWKFQCMFGLTTNKFGETYIYFVPVRIVGGMHIGLTDIG